MIRTYTTRELAQMWNVSESTVKRWADSGDLMCERTPGGHRRFSFRHIHEFQKSRGFEATGLLTSPEWEDPDLEESLNQKNFEKVREQVLYLALANQRGRVEGLLERLYLRGIAICELYDDILVPACRVLRQRLQRGEVNEGQNSLVLNAVEEAMYCLFPKMTLRRPNGKMGLCANPEPTKELTVNAMSRILESEGWESLNLGNHISFATMADMVKIEPVNLVCIACDAKNCAAQDPAQLVRLSQVTREYRIPVALVGERFADTNFRLNVAESHYFRSLRALRDFIAGLTRS